MESKKLFSWLTLHRFFFALWDPASLCWFYGGFQEITNMVLDVPASSNSEWSEDYLPKFACASWLQSMTPLKTSKPIGRRVFLAIVGWYRSRRWNITETFFFGSSVLRMAFLTHTGLPKLGLGTQWIVMFLSWTTLQDDVLWTVATRKSFCKLPCKRFAGFHFGVSVFVLLNDLQCGVLHSFQHGISPVHGETAWQHISWNINISITKFKFQTSLPCTSNRSFNKTNQTSKSTYYCIFWITEKSTRNYNKKSSTWSFPATRLNFQLNPEDSRYPNTFSEFVVGLGWISKWWSRLGNSDWSRFCYNIKGMVSFLKWPGMIWGILRNKDH